MQHNYFPIVSKWQMIMFIKDWPLVACDIIEPGRRSHSTTETSDMNAAMVTVAVKSHAY